MWTGAASSSLSPRASLKADTWVTQQAGRQVSNWNMSTKLPWERTSGTQPWNDMNERAVARKEKKAERQA
jgi:hypothetical protein